MGADLVELDFCCPECNCSQWYCIDDDDKLYGCARCDYVCSFDLNVDDEVDLNNTILDYE